MAQNGEKSATLVNWLALTTMVGAVFAGARRQTNLESGRQDSEIVPACIGILKTVVEIV
jgi:hypothetical protein